ncbi:hypothetical protein HDU86_005140, partial [Geranomyces michiganensis]
MDWKDASALWFVKPAQQPLTWLDVLSTNIDAAAIAREDEATWHARYVQKLQENIAAIPKNTQKTRKGKLKDLYSEIQKTVGREAHREMFAAIMNDAEIMVAARPAAKVGVEL